uniref:NADH-ubiquinone oxidoreductase chain 4L n=1 Tax=Synprosphyma sp. RM-2016 TaxID=1885901 RepID=A0A224A9U4_9EUPU|nr:NADH dehydrogenase subunit 4L [Synprosphyma sp. RM-2016]
MMLFNKIILIIIFFLMLSMVWNSASLLTSLLKLETMLMFMLLFSCLFFTLNCELYLVLLLLPLSVCEASMGLSILVSFIRLHGNDNIKSSLN